MRILRKRYDAAACINLLTAELLYKHGVKVVVTDGKYVEIEKEDIKKEMA